ncbi:hypothetical protein PSP6_270246 [Paraburkholderia tropica]|nr:hypothetical protein PSP6_270246 [Paraburkholderia tropica]
MNCDLFYFWKASFHLVPRLSQGLQAKSLPSYENC